ncbi:MAG: HlyC/CorC family transporter [Methyloligellaceae bacterium]
MTFELSLMLLAIIALLAFSAFFSGSETALTAISRARLHALEKQGDLRARLVSKLTLKLDRLIGAILIGNNLVNILATSLATSFFLSLFGQAGVAYTTILMTPLIVIFSEVLPKTYAIYEPEKTALKVAPILRPIVIFLAPVGAIVQITVRKILRLLGADIHSTEDMLTAHEELRGAIDLHHQEGAVVKQDRNMLGGILDLRDLEVSDVMVHRTTMQTISLDDPPEKVVDEVLKSSYTRLPLWKDEADNIVGILHAKDLLRALNRAKWDISKIDFLELAADPWFIPDSTSLKDQLNAFLRRKAHFALVVDEYGEVMGLVTLEDILEEIVGEISDEHDVVASGVRPQPDGTINVDGAVAIRDLNRIMDWHLPDEEATTIAGLVIHEAQTIPDPGQAFTFYGCRFEVLRRQRNKLTALRITPLKSRATVQRL